MTFRNFIIAVSNILDRKEKTNMYRHIFLDLLIGLLDIAFLGGLLLFINFYTVGNRSGNILLPGFFSHTNPLIATGAFFILYALKNWLGYMITRHQNNFFYDVASRLSKRNLWYYLKSSYPEFIQTDSSVYTRKVSQQPIEFSNYILTNIQQIISQAILISSTLIAILFYHPVTFFSLFLLLLPPVALLVYFIKNKLKNVRSSSRTTSQLAIQYLNESLSGYVESTVYHKNDFFADRYFRQQKQLNENIATMQTLQGLPSRLIEIFAVLGFFILIIIHNLNAPANGLQLFDIGVFMTAAYKIIPGVVKILNSTAQVKTFEFTLRDLMDYPDAKIEAANSPPSPIRSIAFEQVTFSYKHQQILSDFCFEMRPGDFAGISAPSGKGKTTLVNLLLGFLEPDSGAIIINQQHTSLNERANYRRHISYVKQQPFFINDTILKNITLTDGSYDADKLNHAISFCGIGNMLDNYPEGINKAITENGRNISGGQRQLLMLARAIYNDFDLLILDEPFSEVDEHTENEMLAKLAALAEEGKMIIMITHNKYALSACNLIISLNEAYA